MVAIDRYRFPHVRTDMAKHNFLYNRHDMTLREPIERVDKERKGPLPLVERAPHPLPLVEPMAALLVERAYAPCRSLELVLGPFDYEFVEFFPWY
jgi:hypothetical protein